jgi:hypothetical protein
MSSMSVTPPPARARSTACFRDVVYGKDVVPIRLQSLDPISDGLVHELCRGRLFRDRRRIGVPVVLDDDHQRQALHRGEVEPFVKRAGGGCPVADVHEADAILPSHLERHRDAGHDRYHVTQRRDLTDEAAIGVAEMDVELPPARG